MFSGLFSLQKETPKEYKKKSCLDSARYLQCLFYLQHYGTPIDLIEFWNNHRLFEDALRYVLVLPL